jgi:cytochrome c oxidase cbb3-type subunit 3
MGPLIFMGRYMNNVATRYLRNALVIALLPLASAVCMRAQIQPPPVDQAGADRGQQFFTQQCAQCHGAQARGTTTNGTDLIRSLAVLHDRAQQLHGSELAPLLKKPNHTFDLTPDQLADLSQFLTRAVNKTLRSGYSNMPTLMLSGDAKAGEAYFNGEGGCTKCHSVTGDLAGIGKTDAAALQQRLVFPASAIGGRGRGAAAAATSGPPRPKTEVTVTPPGGQAITGTLVRIDDFNVTLQDSSGAQRTFTRTAVMKVDVNDPYAAHVALLSKYTDADIHNLTAYLETLK